MSIDREHKIVEKHIVQVQQRIVWVRSLFGGTLVRCVVLGTLSCSGCVVLWLSCSHLHSSTTLLLLLPHTYHLLLLAKTKRVLTMPWEIFLKINLKQTEIIELFLIIFCCNQQEKEKFIIIIH